VLDPTPAHFSYTVSKAALWILSRTLAQSLAPRIRVNAIAPGPTFPSPRMNEAEFRRQQEATPLRRGSTDGEISAAVRFLLATRSMTGNILALDGGQHLAWQTPDLLETNE
jgi:NAD(P)-dependent dehydrogenase (short-subunit alcohol dehydrogenase family)